MRRLGKIATMTMAIIALCTISTLAANTENKLTPGSDGRTYSLSYTSASGSTDSGKQFILLIVKGETATTDNISVDSILYIDQAAANSSGTVTFSNFQLKNNASAQVFIGGGSLSSPANPYYIHVDGVEVSGTVVNEGTEGKIEATVTLKEVKATTETVVEQIDTVDGAFTFNGVPEGSYKLVCTKSGHLSTTKNIVVTDTEVAAGAITLLGGDVDNTGAINVDDLAALLNNYGRTIEQVVVKGCDIDGSGAINVDDLSILLKNYGKNAVVE